MRCTVCHRFSREVICPECRQQLLVPTITRRRVGTLEVVSLFGYQAIEPLLVTKHTPVGYRIYRYLGYEFVAPFLEKFVSQLPDSSRIKVIGIDEGVLHGYSHTALLTHAAKHTKLDVLHAKLLAKNHVNYAGKTLQYRLDHPRNLRYTGPVGGEAILVDDIITTGLTLQQAQTELQRKGIDVVYALTLADAAR